MVDIKRHKERSVSSIFRQIYRTKGSNRLLESCVSIGVFERKCLVYEAQQDDQQKVLDELLATYGLLLQGRITPNPKSGESRDLLVLFAYSKWRVRDAPLCVYSRLGVSQEDEFECFSFIGPDEMRLVQQIHHHCPIPVIRDFSWADCDTARCASVTPDCSRVHTERVQ